MIAPQAQQLTHRLQCYADTALEQNKFFSWKIKDENDLPIRLHYWNQRLRIRAAYYIIKQGNNILSNKRIHLDLTKEKGFIVFIEPRPQSISIAIIKNPHG